MLLKYSALAAGMFMAGAAQAQVGATLDLGTTGAGFHVVVPMETYMNGRFGANYLQHDFNKTSDGIKYDVKGKLQTFDVLFDWYLREGSPMRLTAGLVYNGNQFDAVAGANQLGKITLNGNSYTLADVGVIKGRVDYRKAAPYLGIGWGNPLAQNKGWSVSGDLGAYFMGSPNVTLGSWGCEVSKTVCDALFKDIAAERLRFADDIDKYKVYPVLRVAVGYHF